MEVAAVGWGISIAGWLISPYIAKVLNKANTHVEVDINISEVVTHLIPRLKFTLEAAEGSGNTATLGKLVSKLKSAFHDTEDILDELEYIRHVNEAIQREEKRRRKRKSSESSPSNKVPPLIKTDLQKNVKIIRELVDEAWKTLSSQNGGSNLRSGSGIAKHEPSASAKNTEKKGARPTGEIIGRDDVRNRIMAMLKNDVSAGSSGTRLSVIGIYGIPGSGKTTLGQHIFRAEKTAGYFNLVMWIHVSENFKVETIFMEMIEQASEINGPCPKYNNLDALTTKLEELLKNKRVLLVLDDVWCSAEGTPKNLPDLLPPLMKANRGSKIVLTGRLQDAVYELGREVRIIDNTKIPELDDDVFLELFMHHAFGHKSEVERYPELVTVGTRIAQKLKKSPLLAKAVGGVLCKKHDFHRWRSFEEQKSWEKHMGPLLWCYQNLDEQAKRCFAYCSIFPRRRHLYRQELVNLWVAEGFVSTNNHRVVEGSSFVNMELVSEECFDELLSVSFLQSRRENVSGKEYFVIHDLLHDLSEKVAGSDFFKIENTLEKAPSDVRYLSIESCSASMITEDIIKLKNLRTLIIFSGEDLSSEALDMMFMELTKLRVLILQDIGFTGPSFLLQNLPLPGSINHLKYLRYLCLQMKRGIDLPGTIGKLYLLQVLDFGRRELFWSRHLCYPTDLDTTGLTNLRHVISAVTFPNIGNLTSLQTMPADWKVDLGAGQEIWQLGDLNNLRGRLEISGLGSVKSKDEAIQAKLADKQWVTSLSLDWKRGWSETNPEKEADVFDGLCPPEGLQVMEIREFHGSRYPKWMFGPEESKMNLQILILRLCGKLLPAPLPDFFFIRVASLKLHYCDWDAMPYNMVHLTELLIERARCVVMPANMVQLTSLRRLIIWDCMSFRHIPALPVSLEYFELEGCNEGFTNSCNEEGHPNYMAIQHIPEKNISLSGRQGLRACEKVFYTLFDLRGF